MTANELIRRVQKIVYQLNNGEIPVKNLGRDLDIEFELVKQDGDYCVETMLRIEYDK